MIWLDLSHALIGNLNEEQMVHKGKASPVAEGSGAMAILSPQSWEEGTSCREGPMCISGPGSLALPANFESQSMCFWHILFLLQ